MDCTVLNWPSANERLTIFSIRSRDRLGVHSMRTKSRLQRFKGVWRAGGTRSARIYFLQGNHVWCVALDQTNDAIKVETRIVPVGTVNIPGHHANYRCGHGVRPRQRLASVWVAHATAPHAATRRRNRTKFVSDKFVINAVI